MSNLAQDYNISGYVPLIASRVSYSDLDISLRRINGDLVPLTDIDAVKSSIRNLVLTDIHERPFQPYLGSRLRSLLFENGNTLTELSIRDEIISVIKNYEPRISELDVKAEYRPDEYAYSITVYFSVNNSTVEAVEFIVNRIR